MRSALRKAVLALTLLSSGCVEFNEECTPFVTDPEEVTGYFDGDVSITKVDARTKNNAMGQLVAEAYYFAAKDAFPKDPPDIGFENGGAIRSEGNVCGAIPTLKKGPLKRKKLRDVLAFDNQVVTVSVTHAALKRIFEHSVSRLPTTGTPAGAFLQVYGVEFEVDCSKPAETLKPDGSRDKEGQRVTSITLVRPSGERVAIPVNPPSEKETVRLAVDNFLLSGSDGYVDLKNVPKDEVSSVGSLSFETVASYFAKAYTAEKPFPAKAAPRVVLNEKCRVQPTEN